MKEFTLSFGKITLLQDDIAEVIVNDMVEMSLPMVAEFHDFLINHLTTPFSLLINKKNSYTYTFDAQLELGNLPQINVLAVVAYNQCTESTTKDLINIPRERPWNVRIFDDRMTAYRLLEEQQNELKATFV